VGFKASNNPCEYGVPHDKWRDSQKMAFEWAVDMYDQGEKFLFCELPTGCHAKGQLIMLHDGSVVPVEDIKVGTQLMGMDGHPRSVLATIKGIGPMNKIIPTKGEPFIVNDKHILTLARTNTHRQYRDAEKLRKDCKYNSIIDVSVSDYLKWSKTQKHIHKLFRVGIDFENDNALPLDPYFLGVLLGDGSITGGIKITTMDKEISDEVFHQARKFNLSVNIYQQDRNRSSDYSITQGKIKLGGYYENPITRILRDLDLFGSTSGNKFIPDIYKTASRNNRLELLAGLMDTDGSLDGTYDYISKSHKLSNDVAYVARSLGFAAYVSRVIKASQNGTKGLYYRVCISGELSIVPCRIKNKQAPVRKQIKSVLRTGFTVEHDGVYRYYGFKLDGDGRYLLGDFTVTHNSGKTGLSTALGSISPVLMHVQTLNLLDQYQNEYGFSVVKGRANYTCIHPDKIAKWRTQGKGQPMVDSCTIEPMNECPYYTSCPYIMAREGMMASKRGGCTYKFGIVSPKVQTRTGFSVLDEAHASANECLEYATITISDKQRKEFDLPMFPLVDYGSNGEGDLLRIKSKKKVLLWLEKCIETLHNEERSIPEWDEDRIKKFKRIKSKVNQAISQLDIGDWFLECSQKTCYERVKTYSGWKSRSVMGFKLRALHAATVAPRLWENKSGVFLMSATIGDPEPIAQEMGITDYVFKSFPHPVPPVNRPIFDLGIEKMTYGNLKKYPSLYKYQANKIWKFINQFDPSWRGIILAPSTFKINKLRELLGDRLGDRLWSPEIGENTVKDYIADPRDGIVAIQTIQGWGHGVNLYGDLARFVVIAGIPFGIPTDNYYKVRQSNGTSSKYTWWEAYNTVPQSAGRVSRGEIDEHGDWITSYAALADGSCSSPFAMHNYPRWFKDAIVRA